MASDILETNKDRKNRKNAEKITIKVEGGGSEEGDGRWNRIAASSAKCKENKARWNFYQGQQRTFDNDQLLCDAKSLSASQEVKILFCNSFASGFSLIE